MRARPAPQSVRYALGAVEYRYHLLHGAAVQSAIAALEQAHNPINEVRGWLAASYANAGHLPKARAALEESLRVAEGDMAIFRVGNSKTGRPIGMARSSTAIRRTSIICSTRYAKQG